MLRAWGGSPGKAWQIKGVIFNVLEDVVTTVHGETTWETMLEAAKVEGAYTSLGTYPDSELLALVRAAATLLDQSFNQVLRWFGREAIARLAVSFPEFFTPHTSTRQLLLTLNDIIHAEVRKLYPDADVPHFDIVEDAQGPILLTYQSPRKLCALAEGFIEGGALHFREQVVIEQVECMHRGDGRCILRCEFGGIA